VRTDIKARYLTLALLDLLNWAIFWYQRGGRLSTAELGELLAEIYVDGVTGAAKRA
jgi:hypothetical protein